MVWEALLRSIPHGKSRNNVVRLQTPSNVSSNQFYLIAAAIGVDANAIAATNLSWQNAATAANSIPMVARIYRKSGTLSLMIATLRLNSTIIQPISAANSTLLGAGADPIQYLLDTTTSATVVPANGAWDFNVTTINGSGSTVDVEVWGFIVNR